MNNEGTVGLNRAIRLMWLDCDMREENLAAQQQITKVKKGGIIVL